MTTPNQRTKTTARRARREQLHTGRYATATTPAGRLDAAYDRARAGIANTRPEHRPDLAENLADVIRHWCHTHHLP